MTGARPVSSTVEEAGSQLCVVWRVSIGLLALQLLGMLVFTTVQYDRFNLTTDFAAYSQAWSAIAHGQLSPYSTAFGQPFWRNDFELLMWPMALLYWVYPHAVTLLWLQVAAVVGAEAVVLRWVRDVLLDAVPDRRDSTWMLGLVTLLLVVTPWSWFTIGFDFHLEPFVTVFALLAARDLWAGRTKRLVLWVPLTLASAASAGALCLMAVGVAGVLSRKVSRKVAVAIVVAGLAWLAFASGIGAMGFRGQPLGPMYGYLTGGTSGHFGMAQLLEGLVSHPWRALEMLRSHAPYVVGYIASGGVIGLRSRWGLVPAAFVILPSALNANSDFIHFAQSFQSWPAVLFIVVGAAFVLPKLTGARPYSRQAIALAVGSLVAALCVAAVHVNQIPAYLQRVSPQAVAKLAATQERAPAGAEFVVSQGIIGRFSMGRSAYPYWAEGSPEQFPISGHRGMIVFVLAPVQGTAEGYSWETRQAIGYVETTLHARGLEEGSGIWSFVWEPPSAARSVVLP
jgi:hypothetical protein